MIKELKSKLKNKKIPSNILILVVFGIILIIAGGYFVEKDEVPKEKEGSVNKQKAVVQQEKTETYEETVEKKLENMLSQIEGAGNVSVMITLTSGEEIVPAKNIAENNTKTEEEDDRGGVRKIVQDDNQEEILVVKKGEEETPVILKKIKPEISGVVVAAEGANNPRIKLDIQNAVKALFNLPSHRIVILKKDS